MESIIEKLCKKNIKFIFKEVKRIVAIGDIHGDMKLLKKLLQISNVIDEDDNWIGKDTYVIQLGDQIDSYRGDFKDKNSYNDEPYDLKIIIYLTLLDKKAKKNNGRVISLMGNHELMNINGDFRYVSYNNIKQLDNIYINDIFIKDGVLSRKILFSRNNFLSKYIACNRFVSVIIGKILFVHAGLLSYITDKYNIKDINYSMILYLFNIDTKKFNEIFETKYSPLLTREYYNIADNNQECDNLLNDVMDKLKIDKIVVGHSIISNIKDITKCNNRIIFTDYGGSIAFHKFIENKTHRVIEILEDGKIINILV